MTKLETRPLAWVGITTLALTLAACGGGGGSSHGTEAQEPVTAALSQATDCPDLLESIRADAREKIRVQANELRERGWWYTGGGLPTPVGTAPNAAPTPAPGAGGPPRDATDTNTQVPGVDEADVVETDGERIFLLHEEKLLVLTATPPEALGLAEQIPIEGFPLGMFVADGRGLVVSSVYDDGPLGGDSRCDAIGLPFPTGGVRDCGASFVKLTLLDLGTTPGRVVREVYVEGSYVAARRHETRARVIVQRFWGAPAGVADPWEAVDGSGSPADEAEFVARVDTWEAAALAAIDASTLEAWLPSIRERRGGALIEHPLDCASAHVAPPGHAQHGTTVIIGMDLTHDDAAFEATTLLGLSEQIYANEDTLVLANPDWQAVPFGEAMSRTALHVFALPTESLDAAYLGSGFVPGYVLSQFSMDVHEDVVRVATTYGRALDGRTVTRVHTARLDDGALGIVGATGDIAPGEVLQSVRFLGERAYLVTFFRVDPLFVVDLHDPTQPTVLGEVEIPGFSQYLHPLDASHLLTIGDDGQGAVALKLFDVGDPTAPRLVDGYELAPEFWSAAQWNHLAFTFDARLGLLALPLNARFFSWSAPVLQLFAVDPTTGIELRGRVDHDLPHTVPCDPLVQSDVTCMTTETTQRAVFIGDYVYSISDRQIRVRRADAPTVHVGVVDLP